MNCPTCGAPQPDGCDSNEVALRIISKLHAVHGGDPEGAHGNADDIILEGLTALGYGEIVEAYEKVRERAGGFWYA